MAAASLDEDILKTSYEPPVGKPKKTSKKSEKLGSDELAEMALLRDVRDTSTAHQGATKKSTARHVRQEIGEHEVQKDQTAELDLLYYRGNVFLIGVLTPLEYSICLPIKDRGMQQITEAVETLLTESKSKGFNVRMIKSDNKGSLSTAEMAHMLTEKRHNARPHRTWTAAWVCTPCSSADASSCSCAMSV